MEITNVTITRHNGYSDSMAYDISCVEGAARYHVWLNTELQNVSKEMHKNSVAKRDQPGYFKHQTLSLTAKANEVRYRKMWDYANKHALLEKANSDWEALQRKEEEDHKQAVRQHRIKDHAMQMYDALVMIDNSFVGNPTPNENCYDALRIVHELLKELD